MQSFRDPRSFHPVAPSSPRTWFSIAASRKLGKERALEGVGQRLFPKSEGSAGGSPKGRGGAKKCLPMCSGGIGQEDWYREERMCCIINPTHITGAVTEACRDQPVSGRIDSRTQAFWTPDLTSLSTDPKNYVCKELRKSSFVEIITFIFVFICKYLANYLVQILKR